MDNDEFFWFWLTLTTRVLLRCDAGEMGAAKAKRFATSAHLR